MVGRDGYPPLWTENRNLCALGWTAAHAICLAALKGWLRSLTQRNLDYLLRVRDDWRTADEE